MKDWINKIIQRYTLLSEPVKASVWYFFANIVNKGLALVATPIFTRVLTEEQYGTYAVYQSWSSILIIFTSLNIFLGGYQKGLLLYKGDSDRFTSSQLGLVNTITVLWLLIYLLNVKFWTGIFELSPLLMLFMFLELLLVPCLDFWAVRQRFEYQYKKYVFVSLLISILSLFGGIIAVIFSEQKVEARLLTDICVKIVIISIIYFNIMLKGKCFFDKKYWLYALGFNIPLIPHYLSNYVLNQSDRLMISKMVGNSETAYYSVAYTISTMMLLVITAINNSLTPYIYKTLDANQGNKLKTSTKPLIGIVACLSIITIVFAPEIIWLFAGERYMDAIYIIPPVSISVYFIFIYSLFSNVEYFYQKTKYIAIATFISAALNVILNYIFINIFGYYAAGYTTLICYIVLAYAHYIFSQKIISTIPDLKEYVYDLKFILRVSICLILAMIVLTFSYQNIMIRYLLLLIAIAIGFVFRKQLVDTLRKTASIKK